MIDIYVGNDLGEVWERIIFAIRVNTMKKSYRIMNEKLEYIRLDAVAF